MTATALGFPSLPRRADCPGTEAPSTGPLIDSHGRVATDLRVSLTDRCNLVASTRVVYESGRELKAGVS
jgi:GTP 3',8-cyclase